MNPIRLALPLCLALSTANAQVVTLNTGGKQVEISVEDAARLPADFPADVALPEHYVLARVERSDGSTTLALDLSGDIDAIGSELASRMRASGWRAAPVARPATGRAQAWEKDGRAVISWLAPGPAGPHLQLQLLR